jgi:glyoxylase-like metal-dependent hydrolase (beta-lactamase superfamily II)
MREGIVRIEGRISRNLMMETIVSHIYFLEDGEEMVIFDPSCGKKIAMKAESYIEQRKREGARWSKATVIAGHSHFDHANNFYLGDLLGAEDSRVYVHEAGFKDGKVMNEPNAFVQKVVDQTKKYYQVYLSFYLPYKILIAPLAALDVLSGELAKKIFAAVGSISFPPPRDGATPAEPIKDTELEDMEIGGVKLKGWKLGDKVLFPTPGHSPCSISLLWPKRKTVLVSDADWVGNPVFVDGSLRDCISSLEMVREFVDAGVADLLLPAHGEAKEGKDKILTHIDFHLRRIELIRQEILDFQAKTGERDILKLTKTLVNDSPLFVMLKYANYPRDVVLLSNMVALSLEEAGVI